MSDTTTPTPSKYTVFGVHLEHVDPNKFYYNADEVHYVGVFDDYDEAFAVWQSEAWRTVDDAHKRFFLMSI